MGNSCCKIPGDEEEDVLHYHHEEDEKKDHPCKEMRGAGEVVTESSSPSTTKGRSIECCICLEPVTTSTKAILNPCVHSDFHESCISSWTVLRKSCPLCYKEIDSIIYQVNGRRYKTKAIHRQQQPQHESPASPSDTEIARQLFYTDLFYPHLFID